jgi:dGTPase
LISDLVEASWSATGDDEAGEPVIRFSDRIGDVANELREFMFQRVYFYDRTRAEADRAKEVTAFLFHYFVAHPEGISPGYSIATDPVERRAADYVSGMTDRFALRLARELGCTAAWDVGAN